MSRRLLLHMIAPFAAISILVFLLGGIAAWYVKRSQTELSDILTVNIASVRAAEELEGTLVEIRANLKEYLYTRDRKFLEVIRVLREKAEKALEKAEHLATTPREQELIMEVRTGYDRLEREVDRALRPDGADVTTKEELTTLTEELLSGEILPPAYAYLKLNEQMADENTERNRVLADRIMLLVLILGTCGAGAGLLACYGMVRGIRRTIAQLGAAIRDAASKLNRGTGPALTATGQDFEELESSMQQVSELAGTVVARLHHSEREVLRSEQLAAVGQMAAGLAHELRNPLMAMKVLVQPAAEPDTGVLLNREDLSVLNEEITRLDRSIQTFLDFARPPQPEKRPFEVHGVVEQAVHLVSARADQCGVEVSCRLPGEPVVIEADMVQVRQVLLNLLLNALDATPEGGSVRIEIIPREEPEEAVAAAGNEAMGPGPSEWCLIRVVDTGIGLPADLGQRIFEPFVSTKDTGMGLGLSICKRIVEAHGGQIMAARLPDKGSAFLLRLPRRGAGRSELK